MRLSAIADTFAAWSIRQAIRRLGAWDQKLLVEALLDERRMESALRLTDEAWDISVVRALAEVLKQSSSPAIRLRIVGNLAGLYRVYPDWSGAWFGTNPLAGQFPEKTKDWSREGMNAVIDGMAAGSVRPGPHRSVARRSLVSVRRVGRLRLFLCSDRHSRRNPIQKTRHFWPRCSAYKKMCHPSRS